MATFISRAVLSLSFRSSPGGRQDQQPQKAPGDSLLPGATGWDAADEDRGRARLRWVHPSAHGGEDEVQLGQHKTGGKHTSSSRSQECTQEV